MKSTTYGSLYMSNRRKDPAYKTAFNAYKREWRHRRYAAGLCECSRPATHGRRCDLCWKRHRMWACSPKGRAAKKLWYQTPLGRKTHREAGRRANARLRNEIIAAYGRVCVCCAESMREFLTIDHVYGRTSGQGPRLTGKDLYRWLKKNGFPRDGFQLMCFNCNSARGFLGRCPHEGQPTGRWNRTYGLVQGGKQ